MKAADARRPELSPALTGDELKRWYWLKGELAAFARQIGVRATGSKDVLTRRIAATLDGEPFQEPEPARRSTSAQLSAPLTPDTVTPAGQRCSQVVRAWFSVKVGDGFHFDAQMRDFFAHTDGTQTLQDALSHYRDTRAAGPREIGPQFEFNQFTRAWREEHKVSTHQELLDAWNEYRNAPVDERVRI